MRAEISREDLEEGAGREVIPNNPITPALREALKDNKRMDEIQNLSLPEKQNRHLLYARTGIKSVFSPGNRAGALERFAETVRRQRDNLDVTGRSRERTIKPKLK